MASLQPRRIRLQNRESSRCAVVSVAAIAHTIGIDQFPGLPDGIKATAMTLPKPEANGHATRRRRCPALLGDLLDRLETP